MSQSIVRHYRAATRDEAAQAYRSDALKAAGAGFVAIDQTWSEGADGLLLAVTYSGPDVDDLKQAEPSAQATAPTNGIQHAVEAETFTEPEREPEPEPELTQPERTYTPVQRISTIEPDESAEQELPEPESEPSKRYTPPPEMYEMPEGMYVPVVPEEADEAESVESVEPEAVVEAPEVGEAEISDEAESTAEAETEAEQEAVAQPEAVAETEAEPEAEAESESEPEAAVEPEAVAEAAVEPEAVAEAETEPEAEAFGESEPDAVAEAEPDAEAESESEADVQPEMVAEAESEAEPEVVAEADAPQVAERESETPLGSFPELAAEAAAATLTSGRSTRMTLQVMDLHTAGEPLRLVRSGFPDVPMLPVLERRQWVKDNVDNVRKALMYEPRGHSDMYGAILLPPYNDYADMTVLFMHNEGYSTMCGHGVIAITTGLIEEGLYPATEPVTTIRYEVPAGIVAANAATVKQDDGTWAVRGVRFTNVPSYLAAQSLSIRPDGVELHGTAAEYGALGMDLAFGGAYYGIVNAAELGLRVVPEQADELRRVGAAITEVLRRDHTPAHPSDPDLSFVYGTIIVDLDPSTSPDGKARGAHIRNATIFADAELDRSPCGTGTSAILAQLHARGRIKVGQEIINAGITGEHFLGRVEAETALGPYAAVSTSIAGTAFVTGYTTFIIDSRDPLGDGFLLG